MKRFIPVLLILVAVVWLSLEAFAQRSPMPYAKIQLFDRNGRPCAGCRLWSYVAGTTTMVSTYVSATGSANTNPVVLDASGRANVWMSGDTSYKFILEDSSCAYKDPFGTCHGVQLWAVDNVTDYGAYLSAGGSIFAGDITGAYDSTVVERIQGIPVSDATPVDGQVMVYDTNQWVPGQMDLSDNDAITGTLPSNRGGTGNGFVKFSGPTATEKTFTLPNASATILTDNALVESAQGGTGSAYFKVAGPTEERTYTFPDANGTIPRVLAGSGVLNFPSTSAQTSADLTIVVTGAAVGDPVAIGTPAAPAVNTSFTAFVSAADTVTVRFHNYSSGAVDPDSGTYKVTVFK
jgi:hypothetical protein